MDDYYDKFYNKIANRSKLLSTNDYSKAKEIVAWKEDTVSKWDHFEVIELDYVPDQTVDFNNNKDTVYGRVVIDKKDLNCDLGIDCVVVEFDPLNNKYDLVETYEFDLVKQEGTLLYFESRRALNDPGVYQYGLRVFPKNADLPHRMDFAYVRWIG